MSSTDINYKGFRIKQEDNNYLGVYDPQGRWEFSMRDTLAAVKKEIDKLAKASPLKPFVVKLGKTSVPLPLSEREMAEEPIDPEILELVADLNYQGLKTVMSCAGHPLGGGELPHGLIMFSKKLTLPETAKAKKTAQHYGLKNVRVTHELEPFPKPAKVRTSITFEALSE